ncbi:hypothetical protein D4A92_22715 (plasmid) [Rhizobium rosettiformans]|uniref:Glycosyltransferase family 4 protein n=2 Tax=Rhizobium rosettiformans TaxID=1368430 RepID=A0ABX7F2A4_9HYPH|nr:hypothetical protein D4A92_22715 [Rhizobium rosettiformans]
MQDYFGYELIYVPPTGSSIYTKPFSYISQWIKTLEHIKRSDPDVVWIQTPPTFLPHILLSYRFYSRRKFRIVFDCHNSTFYEPWVRIPGLSWALRRGDAVLVHNSEIARTTRHIGLGDERLVLLETRPAQVNLLESANHSSREVLVPCSFKSDEPVEAIIDAAKLSPDITYILTGNYRRYSQAWRFEEGLPPNLKLTSYISTAEFNRLLSTCSVVLGLTTREGVQLSVANEAVGAGKPMVLSDTKILRDLFGEAALFCNNTGVSIAQALQEALSARSLLANRSVQLRSVREVRWTAQANALKLSLDVLDRKSKEC